MATFRQVSSWGGKRVPLGAAVCPTAPHPQEREAFPGNAPSRPKCLSHWLGLGHVALPKAAEGRDLCDWLDSGGQQGCGRSLNNKTRGCHQKKGNLKHREVKIVVGKDSAQNQQCFASLFSFEKTQSHPRRHYGFGFRIFSHLISSLLWPF